MRGLSMVRMLSSLVVAMVLLACGQPGPQVDPPAVAGGEPSATVSGTLTYGDVIVEFKDAVAYAKENPWSDEGPWSVVVLADIPLDEDKATEKVRKSGRFSPSFCNELTLTLRHEPVVHQVSFFVANTSFNTSSEEYHKVEFTVADGHVKGHAWMDQPGEAQGESYTFDVTFDLDLLRP